MTILLIQAKDNSNMFKRDLLNEALELQKYLLNKFQIFYDGRNITYSELCDPCNI